MSAYNYFRHLNPDAQFEIYDNTTAPKRAVPSGVSFHGGVKDFYNIDADLVIRTPSISPSKVSSSGIISTVTQEFFDRCPVSIIGVTGTKGKGTTASLITKILQESGMKTWLVGNIGMPALDVLESVTTQHDAGEECVVVYELSSFQLWDMTKSPHVAVVLMVEPEHLDVHADFTEYVEAKTNITKHQVESDIAIYYAANTTSVDIARHSIGRKIAFSQPEGNELLIGDEAIVGRDDIALYGEHNVGNVQAAILAAWQFTQDKQAIRRAVQGFSGLPHRLEPVATKNNILYINDSFSSAPPATLAAVKSFVQPTILIMGGYDRGLDFTRTVRSLVELPNLKQVLLIGQNQAKIAACFDECGWKNYRRVEGDLASATIQARDLADSGDIVLLSPGSASFDMFKNFTERGDIFKEVVNKL